MAIIEMILFEATFVEFLIVILLLALLKRKRKHKGTEFGTGIPVLIDQKEKKDYERVQAILEGVQNQKLKQEISAIPQIEKNLEEFDKIARETEKETSEEKPKGDGFFLWLKKKIKSWKKHREKAKQESLKREEERRKQEILEQRKEERKKKREEQIKKKITRINYRKEPINKKIFVYSISIIIVLIIIGSIIFFAPPLFKTKYNSFDVVPIKSTGLNMNLYYKQNKLFTVSGWESKLDYDKKEDRIAGKIQYKQLVNINGTNYFVSSGEDKITLEKTTLQTKNQSIGWFYNDLFNFNEKKTYSNKFVSAELISNSSIKEASYNYTLYKNKPYFKLQFSALAENPDKLRQMAYGFILNGYNIHLPNGTILTNDNEITKLDKTPDVILNGTKVNSSSILTIVSNVTDIDKQAVQRKGSNYKFDNVQYQIFNNPKTNISIVVYSPGAQKFSDSFYWNVYWVYVNGTNGVYSPIYFIVLEDSTLEYNKDAKDWQVKSKYYTGNLTQYIYTSVDNMNKIK